MYIYEYICSESREVANNFSCYKRKSLEKTGKCPSGGKC